MKDTESLEGWVPEIGDRVTLEEVIERAFDYRGNVTVVRADGARLEGYVFNRNRDVPVPFIQVFGRAGGGRLRALRARARRGGPGGPGYGRGPDGRAGRHRGGREPQAGRDARHGG